MTNYPAQVVVKVLYQEFPDLAQKVNDKIKEKLPDIVLHDHDLISIVVHEFCNVENIRVECLLNENGLRQNSNKRRILLALILKLYQPELLTKLLNGVVNISISRTIKKLIPISKKTFSNDIRTAIHHYQLYKDFKLQVDQLHTKIIENYGSKKANDSEAQEV